MNKNNLEKKLEFFETAFNKTSVLMFIINIGKLKQKYD